ncbi:iron ABC transporter substrate-binding protein [Rhodopseudomonas palustris]|uniref:Iron ABC transporter substrate-binding protein n=1 Tax=Rhodopseudomonas palustris TaxID=1076 RepID=A0A323UW42_RHOPL|nr:ABC transporter substrate-binding protein [Rhodopseudomonas palustris]PZA11888.1 iron ABC transporter substrate-binding protein [Rhodopseudomonas palustris]
MLSQLRGMRWALAMAIGVAAVCAALGPVCAGELTDQRGATVAVATPAQRVVFLPMPAPSTYMAIDRSVAHIAGMNPASATAMKAGILGRIYPSFDKIPTGITRGAGVVPNVEAIMALHPDAVLQWATSGDEPIAMLDRAGLTVLGLRYGGQDEVEGAILMMGRLAGQVPRATAIVERQRQRRAALAAAFGALSDAERPRVLHLSRASDSFAAAGRDTYSDFVIRTAGGRNAAGEIGGSRAVTLEQLLVWNPDVILLGNFDTATPDDLYRDPRLQGVAAVRDRRVYRVPLGGYRWDPPSHESALAWTWLAGLLHPARVAIDLRADMRDWYTFLYDYKLSDGEIDDILRTRLNGGSAGYARFAGAR